MQKIAIIGGGNFGSLLASKFSHCNCVYLYTTTPKLYRNDLSIFTEDTNSWEKGNIAKITNSLPESINNADYIFITYPAFLFEQIANKIIPLLKPGQHLFCIPGSGGFELFFKKALDIGCTITGLQRVHCVARIIEKGKSVKESGIRSHLLCASIPATFNAEAASILSELYGIPVQPLSNYLNITLINSNPILHTSRLYSICKDFSPGSKLPLFYEEWSLESSELLIKMDKELFKVFNYLETIGLPVTNIKPLLEHYESIDALSLTNKIRSIFSLKGLETPNTIKSGIVLPDYNSRYFTADFPFGLDILISFANALDVECPTMIQISDWYHQISGTKRVFSLQTFGIKTIDDLKKFYNL